MNESKKGRWFSVGRVVNHAILGAFIFAFLGTLCAGTAGGFAGWIFNLDQSFIHYVNSMVLFGARMGVESGALTCGPVGAIALALNGFFNPQPSLWPAKSILLTAIKAMFVATVGFMASYCVLCVPIAIVWRCPFPHAFVHILVFILRTAPTTGSNLLTFITFSPGVAAAFGLIFGVARGFRRQRQDQQWRRAVNPLKI